MSVVAGRQDAVTVYGSLARGDYDAISDRDVLLVSDDPMVRTSVCAELVQSRWTCTAYSWSRLHSAFSHGALFLQHLKQESRIVHDPAGRLRDVLGGFSPRTSYNKEVDDAKRLIGTLERVPSSKAGRMWVLDVLMVGLRSLSVATLANEGVYRFSLDQILDGLVDIGICRRSEATQLLALRYYKAAYRKGQFFHAPAWSMIVNLIDLVDRAFSIGLHVRLDRGGEILEMALQKNPNVERENWYIQLRRIEGALWSLKPTCSRRACEFLRQRERLFRLVRAPTEYAWHFGPGYDTVREQLCELALACTSA